MERNGSDMPGECSSLVSIISLAYLLSDKRCGYNLLGQDLILLVLFPFAKSV